jgi:gliding motility-associated-like protein
VVSVFQFIDNLSVFLDSSNEGWIQNQLTYWYKIQSVYTPDSGNYQFMYVGNFLSDSVTPLKCLDTIGNNCKGDTYYLFRDFNVIEFTPIENYALNDTAVCIGQSISLSNEQSQSGHTYSWYTKDGFLSSNLNLLVKPLQTTKYYLYTTDSVNNICDCNPPVLDSVTVTVINYDVAGVNAITQERSLCSGDTVQFGIVERSGYSYQWQPSNYLSSDTVAQPFVQVPWYLENNILTYNVTITNTQNQSCTLNNDLAFKIVVNFCPDSLEPQIYIPNVFTPNGDGENDVFKLITQNIKDLKAEVYNRWGIRVNSFSGVNGNWQGKTIAGDSAPTGIYYVIITAEGMDKKTYHYSGYVHLY